MKEAKGVKSKECGQERIPLQAGLRRGVQADSGQATKR